MFDKNKVSDLKEMAQKRISKRLASMVRRALKMPPSWSERLGGALPISDRGFALDRQTQLLLGFQTVTHLPTLDQLSLPYSRAQMHLLTSAFDLSGACDIRDLSAPGPTREIPIRSYRPKGSGDKTLPALIFYHGGGFVLGSIKSHDGVCRFLCEQAQIAIFSVDYALAPEYPFPAAIDESVTAFDWITRRAQTFHINPKRIAVGGDSAGGNIAAVLCLIARDEQKPVQPCFQLLIYPTTDIEAKTPSKRNLPGDFFLTSTLIDWFFSHYIPNTDPYNWRVSPLRAEDHKNLPPAMLLTAGFDPLRDEGILYAKKLVADGVEVEHRCYESLIHGFLNLGGVIKAAEAAVSEIAVYLRMKLHTQD